MTRALLILIATASICAAQERALIDTVTGDIQKIREFKVEAKPNPQKWVPVIRDARPTYDAATEKLARTNIVTSTNITISFVKVRLSTAELDEKAAKEAARIIAEADTADRLTKRDRVGKAVATLRQWKVDADATTVTSGNAVAVLQQLSNRFGRLSEFMADLLEAEGIDE